MLKTEVPAYFKARRDRLMKANPSAAFVFPALNLYHGAVRVYTRAGDATAIDLFWGLDQSLWSPGSTITLRDAAGTIKSTFTIPN